MATGTWTDAYMQQNSNVGDAVDLGDSYFYLNIYIPRVKSGVIYLQVGETLAGDFKELGIGTSGQTSTTSGERYTTLQLGGYQYIKVCSGTQQTDGITFRVRGYS